MRTYSYILISTFALLNMGISAATISNALASRSSVQLHGHSYEAHNGRQIHNADFSSTPTNDPALEPAIVEPAAAPGSTTFIRRRINAVESVIGAQAPKKREDDSAEDMIQEMTEDFMEEYNSDIERETRRLLDENVDSSATCSRPVNGALDDIAIREYLARGLDLHRSAKEAAVPRSIAMHTVSHSKSAAVLLDRADDLNETDTLLAVDAEDEGDAIDTSEGNVEDTEKDAKDDIESSAQGDVDAEQDIKDTEEDAEEVSTTLLSRHYTVKSPVEDHRQVSVDSNSPNGFTTIRSTGKRDFTVPSSFPGRIGTVKPTKR